MTWLSNIQWGTVGEWVGGVGALVPGVLWFFERKDRKVAEVELAQERKGQRIRLRRQQIQGVHVREVTKERTPYFHSDNHREWVIRNDSSAPLRFTSMEGRTVDDVKDGPPAGMVVLLKSTSRGSLAVGEERSYSFDSPAGITDIKVTVEDAAGVRWVMHPPRQFEEVDGAQ